MNQEREQDRIMHLLLAEGVGRQTPPDMSERIMDRAFPPVAKPLPKLIARPTVRPAFETVHPPAKVHRPLIFRLARPLIGAAMLTGVIGLYMYFNRPYPPPAVTGDYSVAGGGPVARGSEVVTTDRTARVTLGGLYQVDLSPRTRMRIGGLPGAEEVSLLDGEVTCDVENKLGDLVIKTDLGTLRGSDVQFRASIRKDPATAEGENMISRKLFVTVLSGVLSISGPWGEKSFAAGHEQAFTLAGPTAVPVSLQTKGTTANPVAQGTLVQVLDQGLTLQVGTVTTTVHFDDTPQVKINDKVATLVDLKPGMTVVVQGTSVGTVILASAHTTTTQPTTTATTTVTGTVQQVGTDGVTVHTASGNVNFAVTSATTVRVGTATATLADVKAGMNIAVVTADGKTAKEIRAYVPTTPPTPTPTPPATTTVTGSIQQVGNDGVTVHTSTGNVNFTVTSATTIRVGTATATISDLKAGMSIAVVTADGKTAKEIRAYVPTTPQPPTPTPPVTTTVTGSIQQVGNDGVTVHTSTGNVNFTVTSATTIRVGTATATISDLKAGMNIAVVTADGKTAKEIRAYAPTTPQPPATTTTNITGTISAVTGNQVTIKSGTKSVTLTITTTTIIRIKDVLGAIGDLKVGMNIAAASSDGKTATEIHAYLPTTTTATK